MKKIDREATVIIAKCEKSKRPFGIRVEKTSDGVWHKTWAFKIDEKAASREGYDTTSVSGEVVADPEFPGCPYCGSMGLCQCGNCNKLTCYDGGRSNTCAWCGNSGELETLDSVDWSGGGY